MVRRRNQGTWLLALVSLPLLVSGVRWARQASKVRGQTAWPLAVTCGALTVVHRGALFYISTRGGTFDVFRLSWLLFWAPSALLLPLSAAVALFFARRRRGARSLFALAAVLALLPVVAGTMAFRQALVDEPLGPEGPAAPAPRRKVPRHSRATQFAGTLRPPSRSWQQRPTQWPSPGVS